jgi:hypothetical protein
MLGDVSYYGGYSWRTDAYLLPRKCRVCRGWTRNGYYDYGGYAGGAGPVYAKCRECYVMEKLAANG